MNKPCEKISIITVVYNGEKGLEETILSVINQKYNNLEYIVIDGGSKDNSVEIIKKYEESIAYWISEPDKGIYDAMNKGLKICTGKWVNFMNVGDKFSDPDVLMDLFKIENGLELSDIIYGNVILDMDIGLIKRTPKNISDFKKGMVFNHQCCFVRGELIKATLFDTSFKISADYNMLYNFYKSSKVFKYIDRDIAIYEAREGISTLNPEVWKREDARVRGELNSIGFLFGIYRDKMIKRFTKFLKFVFPSRLINKMRVIWIKLNN